MPRAKYEDEIIVSWVELHRDARYLSEMLHAKGSWKGIIAITRGGLIPAALVARELDIRLVDTICVMSYGSSSSGQAEQVQSEVKVLKGVAGDGDGICSSTTWSTPGGPPASCASCCPRPTSPPSTPSHSAAPSWTHA